MRRIQNPEASWLSRLDTPNAEVEVEGLVVQAILRGGCADLGYRGLPGCGATT